MPPLSPTHATCPFWSPHPCWRPSSACWPSPPPRVLPRLPCCPVRRRDGAGEPFRRRDGRSGDLGAPDRPVESRPSATTRAVASRPTTSRATSCSASATVLRQRRRAAGRRGQRDPPRPGGMSTRVSASTPSTRTPGSCPRSPRAARRSASTARASASTRARPPRRSTGSRSPSPGTVNQFELTDTDADGLLDEHDGAHLLGRLRGRGLRRRRRQRRALHQRGERRAVALLRRARPAVRRVLPSTSLTSAGGHLINDIEGVTLVDQPTARASSWSRRGSSDPEHVLLRRLPTRGLQRLREDFPGQRRHHLGRL